MNSDPTEINPPLSSQTYDIEFSGSALEYFKIWIVNVFLTIITLGIYSAWAKVRTRRYFYACTSLANHPFDYLANPINIFKGHLIVGAMFICYLLADLFSPQWSFALVVLFYIVFPFLAYKSVKFYTHNSAHRNIRFGFSGTLKQSYQLFLFKALLIPLTLGLYLPRWMYLRKLWFFGHAEYGSTMNGFEGRCGLFYKTYIMAFLQFVLILLIPIAAIGAVMYWSGGMPTAQSFEDPAIVKFIVLAMVAGYGGLILAGTIPQEYLFSRITNHCWNSSQLGRVTINSDLKIGTLVFIRLTNILAILFSLGLMLPWAKVRRTRYVLGCLSVESSQSLDEFAAGNEQDVSAVGDAAADFFDFDIGL